MEFYTFVASKIAWGVPPQYRLLAVLYVGFLGSVIIVNIVTIILKWAYLWILRRN